MGQNDDVLGDVGCFTSKCEKEVWTRDQGDSCEHTALCVGDLMIASKDPEAIVNVLMEKHQFKLKGTCPAKFHLGCDFF